MSKVKHVVVFRFSSLGDVAMTVPVIKNVLAQHPHLHITFVSTSFHAPLFAGIDRLSFYAADLKGNHKGFAGLFRLFKELRSFSRIDAVADLHNVLRTRILKLFFTASGIRWESLDKGRAEKKALTRAKHKVLKQLSSTFQRYADVFATLGFPVQLNIGLGHTKKMALPALIQDAKANAIRCIGIAPFAQYSRKTYPPGKMQEALRLLLNHDVQLFLLGGKRDVPTLRQWATENSNTTVVAGSMSFAEELALISNLDVMVSMDSANMHLASLYGVPVVSIWGATHPFAGFYGWGQDEANAVQVELYCRPCSVFGNKQGPREDLACMLNISPLSVYDKVLQVLGM